MVRSIAILALLGMSCCTGCRMCQSPYDYCGPVYQQGYPTGGFFDRRYSILGPGVPAPSSYEATMPDPQPTLAPVPPNNNPPPMPGS